METPVEQVVRGQICAPGSDHLVPWEEVYFRPRPREKQRSLPPPSLPWIRRSRMTILYRSVSSQVSSALSSLLALLIPSLKAWNHRALEALRYEFNMEPQKPHRLWFKEDGWALPPALGKLLSLTCLRCYLLIWRIYDIIVDTHLILWQGLSNTCEALSLVPDTTHCTTPIG